MPKDKIMTRYGGWVDKPKESYDYSKLNPLKWLIIIAFIREYPDRLLDLARKEDADYDVALLQRLYLRAGARSQETFITGGRGSTKTYCAVGSQLTEGSSAPGMMSKHIAPSKEQSADILESAIQTYKENFPLLMQEWVENRAGATSVKITNKEGSSIQSHATLPSNRGDNMTRVVPEECGQEDKFSKPFNWGVYRQAVRPAVRVGRKIKGLPDENSIPNKEFYITSATSQQNPAYEVRNKIKEKMKNPPAVIPKNRVGTGFVMGNSWIAPVACGIRDIHWAKSQMDDLLPEERLREMGGIWTGIIDNPMVTDTALGLASQIKCAEFEHCEQPNVHYVIGVDTSYSDRDGNAMCACVVIKATEKEGRFFREAVNTFDFIPPHSDKEQAIIYKKLYNDYTPKTGIKDAGFTLICIDVYGAGHNIVSELMRDLGDGLLPLKCTNGWKADLELPDAVPCIVPIAATGGTTDQEYITLENAEVTVSDMIMVSDIRREFTTRNIHLLTSAINDGVTAYNKLHGIKDSFKSSGDGMIHSDCETVVPYIKTRELVGQIRNLKVVGGKEQRVSMKTNRDLWSALKYANRGVTILEKQLLRPRQAKKEPPRTARPQYVSVGTRLVTRHGGKRY